MKKARVLTLLLGVVVLLTVATPAQAAEWEQSEDPYFMVFPNEDYGIVVFWNMAREDLCLWIAGGEVGPPPVVQLVPVESQTTDQGALKVQLQAERPVEIWKLDDDAVFSGPCEDTDAQPGVWATGSVDVRLHDNNVFVVPPRPNGFGDRGDGVVYDGDGQAWSFGWTFRALIENDEFTVLIDETHLIPI